MRGGVVASEQLHHGTNHSIRTEIGGKDLSIELFVAIQPGQARVKGQIQQGVVNLRGMDGVAVSRMIGWESNRPRQIAMLSIATAVHEAADSPQYVSKRDTGCQGISKFPNRQLLPAQINNPYKNRPDQAAVKDKAPMLDHENFGPGLAGKALIPISDYIPDARADDGSNDQPWANVHDAFRGKTIP